jgi:hypothetical protein
MVSNRNIMEGIVAELLPPTASPDDSRHFIYKAGRIEKPHRKEGTTATRLGCRIGLEPVSDAEHGADCSFEERLQRCVWLTLRSSISSSSGQPGEGRDNLESDDDVDEEHDEDEAKIDDSSTTNRDEMEEGDRNACDDDDENSYGTADWMRTKQGSEHDERINRAQEIAENALMEWMDSDGDESEDEDDGVLGSSYKWPSGTIASSWRMHQYRCVVD